MLKTVQQDNKSQGLPSGPEIRKAAYAALAQKRFIPFCTYVDPTYEDAPHVKLLGEYLEWVEDTSNARLIITMPPRHGKSHTTSGLFPAWCLGRDSTRSIILGSHTGGSSGLATKFSVQVRDLIRENVRYQDVFPGVSLDPNKQGQEMWCLTGRPETFLAKGVGGGISGFGAWLLLIDDPIADDEEARSLTHLNKIWAWYKKVAQARLLPGGRVIIIMTRWAEGDLVGKLAESVWGTEFRVLHLPALSYGTSEEEYRQPDQTEEELQRITRAIPKTAFPDPLGRPKGEALWPKWYSKEYLERLRSELKHDFECLYQGNPVAPEGEMFQLSWFRSITPELLERLKKKVIFNCSSYDLAWSAKTTADFTVRLKARLIQLNDEEVKSDDFAGYSLPPLLLLIEDVKKWQLEWAQSHDKILNLALDDGHEYQILVEAVASQNVGFKSLRGDMRLYKHNLTPVIPVGDKTVRAKLTARLASRGHIFILNGSNAPWYESFVTEVTSFPYASNDDQVDALTQMINYHADRIINSLMDAKPFSWKTGLGGLSQKKKDFSHLPFELRPKGRRLGGADILGWRQQH